jgi:hypothetical protein
MNAENAERNLWDQIRSLTQISIRLAQWGITALLALLTALFFIRNEMRTSLVDLPRDHPLPWWRFIPGDLILWMVAILFFRMSAWIRKRLFYYIEALRNLPKEFPEQAVRVYPEFPKDTTAEPPPGKTFPSLRITHHNRTMGIHIVALFFFVPLADCILYGLQWVFWWLKT